MDEVTPIPKDESSLGSSFSASMLCSSFYASHGIPMASWFEGKRVAAAGYPWGAQPDENALHVLSAEKRNLSTIQTIHLRDGGLYGFITRESSGHQMIIGPVYSHEPSDEDVVAFLGMCHLSKTRREEIGHALRSIPKCSTKYVSTLLSFLNNAINGDDTIVQEEYQQSVYDSASDVHQSRFLEDVSRSLGSSYEMVSEIAYNIRQGDIDEVWRRLGDRYMLSSTAQEFFPSIAGSRLRGLKDEFIVIAAEAFLHGVVPAGIDFSSAVKTMGSYIEHCETARTERELEWLFQTMLSDAVLMVNESDATPGFSQEVKECMRLISTDLANWPTIDELANQVGCSKSNLTRKFKKEAGMSINQYARTLRVERAKRLLRYSDYSVATISMTLGFSSQPYFANTFKRETGATPTQYRAKANDWSSEEDI